MVNSKEMQLGKAGEYLVCADLITKGFVAFPSEQGLSYDVVLDVDGRLLRVQVKTTERPRIVPQRDTPIPCYMFNIKRMGKFNGKRVDERAVDLFALVAIDSKTIGYLKNSDLRTSMNFRVDAMRGEYYDEKGASDFRMVQKMVEQKKSKKEISIELGLNLTTVYRMAHPDYVPFKTSAKYLSDIQRESGWFYEL